MADLTDCIDFTAAYVNFNRLGHGGFVVTIDTTGDDEQCIIAKATGFTTNAFYLEQLQLGCSSNSARLYDSSAGGILGSCLGSDISCQGFPTTTSDFRPNTLVCLTGDNTVGICLSSSDGNTWGRIQGSWGPLPK